MVSLAALAYPPQTTVLATNVSLITFFLLDEKRNFLHIRAQLDEGNRMVYHTCHLAVDDFFDFSDHKGGPYGF